MNVGLIENQDQPVVDEESLNTNPLLISVIINRILEYLPFHDLKTCRLISILWNKTVTSSKHFKLKSKNFVVFGARNRKYYSEIIYSVGAMDRLGNCLRSPLRMGTFPLHTFIVVTSGISQDSNLKESTLINFLNAISPIAQKILIEHDRAFVPLHKNEVANWSVFPTLKYLKLKLCRKYETQPGILWEFLGHLMQQGNAPQLEKLHLHEPGTVLPVPHSSLSKLISTINVPATTSKLKSLKMKSPLELQHLREFHALELNLRELHIEVKDISHLEAISTVRSILAMQSKTLVRLNIIDWEGGFWRRNVVPKEDIFPKLPNLETLIIYTEKIVSQNILLKERFPRLKSLVFPGWGSPWNEFLVKEIQPTLSINEIAVTRRFTDEGILHKAVHCFPNIRKLQIPAVSYITNVIFDKLSELEELTLDTTDVVCIDDIITGLTSEECEDAFTRMTDWKKNIGVLATLRDVRLTTIPISCLTKLKTLRLFSMDNEMVKNQRVGLGLYKKKAEITKLSYLMVLLNMNSLRCLDFGKRDFPPDYQVQPSVWKRVCGKFEIRYMIREPVLQYRR